MKLGKLRLIGLLLAGILLLTGVQAQANLPLDTIQLPPGFSISLYAADVPGARSLNLSENGTLFVGTRGSKVYAVTDADGDQQADQMRVIADGLNSPNGVAFHDGALYVAELGRVIRFDDIEANLDNPPAPVVVKDGFYVGEGGLHAWKFIAFGPDGMLYVPVGFPCNVCADSDQYGILARMNPDGTGLETFASGIRNTVGFDWQPETGALWFTDNGRDWLGDDQPPDELNRAPYAGLHFGFPYCHAGTIADPDFGSRRSCDEFTPPATNLGPHVAALGMRFYTGDLFPAEYANQIFIAEHGSWNRTTPIGYQVSLVRLDETGAVTAYEPFATGWLQSGGAWGRPVDVLVMPDGALLVSDDQAGVIYRISYNEA
ncbi:MAG TPA: PQQ-dependent sugar dehydrogenase [Phototrophicaceae bacterium]|nr:PQQ-dependent sugar dehydrogenase [Phototrophicaceae bacterium]